MPMRPSQREVQRSSALVEELLAAAVDMRSAILIGDGELFTRAEERLRAAEDELLAMSPMAAELRRERLRSLPEDDER